VLDQNSQVIAPFTLANCDAISEDTTLKQVTWGASNELSALQGQATRFRFTLTDGSLYAFWVSPDASGASYGYIGTGGPGFTGPIDTVGSGLDDTTPPTPDPLVWASVPSADGEDSISMTATTASDPSGVEYFFDETSGNPGGSDSGWQSSQNYTDTGLNAGTQYCYQVKARDLSTNNNETAYSSNECATTTTPDTTPPTPDPMTWNTFPYSTGSSSIAMAAATASDPSGVQYSFECTIGGGNNSGWQASPSYEDTGLTPDTSYTYRVKARDMSPNNNETGYSSQQSAITDPLGPVDDYTDSDIAVQGTVSGSYTDTQSSDDVYESITEVRQGNPSKGFSSLEHKWTINVSGGDVVTFYVEAHQTSSSDSDNFVFAYSTDDSVYTDMLTVSKTSDNDTSQSYALPASLSGTVYIRALDTDSTQGNQNMDTLYVDLMYITSEPAGPPDTDPPTPDPMTWATLPYSTGSSSIAMVADTATDASGVEYYFDETSGNPGGADSGWQDSTSYEDTGLQADTTYTYTVKARDKSTNQNETATSTAESATTDAGCTPTDCHVESIVCDVQSCGGPNKNGLVTVTIYDDCGNVVVGADVTGTFTGSYSETPTETTDGNGQATFVTAGCVKKPSYTFCVDDVVTSLPYDDTDNVVTCNSN
jgi:hypothetical protein